MTSISRPIIGLLPAAGQGSRLHPLSMSKELFPIGFQDLAGKGPRPKVACQYLLESMKRAGIGQAYIVLTPGKWDIPAYLGDGTQLGLRLAYLTVHVPFGVPFSLNQAVPFLGNAIVAMGFPDILFSPSSAYSSLLERLLSTDADVVLGLFPTDQPQNVGVVDFDTSNRVLGIYEKSNYTHLHYMWAIAVWQPRFTAFLHQTVTEKQRAWLGDVSPVYMTSFPEYEEMPIGDVIQLAIAAGLRVDAVPFEAGQYLDIGTPTNLVRAVHDFGLVDD